MTIVFYHHPQRFRILHAPSDNPRQTAVSVVVDTIEDFWRLETISSADEVGMEAEQ